MKLLIRKGFVECSRRKKGGLENRGWRNLSMERKIEQIVAPLFEASQGRLSSSEIVPHLLLLCYPWVSTCTPRSGREPLGLLCPLWEQFWAMADVADPALGLALLWGPPWPEKVLCWTQAWALLLPNHSMATPACLHVPTFRCLFWPLFPWIWYAWLLFMGLPSHCSPAWSILPPMHSDKPVGGDKM